MKRLVPTEEAAKIENVTPRTIERWFEAGKPEGEFKAGKRAGKSGLKLFVWIDEDLDSRVRENDKKEKLRIRIHRGEPGQEIVTPLLNGVPIDGEPRGVQGLNSTGGRWGDGEKNPPTNNIPISKPDSSQNTISLASVGCSSRRPVEDGDHNKAGGEGVAVIGAPGSEIPPVPALLELPDSGVNLPAIRPLDSCFRRNDKAVRIANLRFALIQTFNEEINKNYPSYVPENGTSAGRQPKKEIVKNFLDLFNSGFILPEIHNTLKKIKRSTLYNWLQLYDQGGVDALVPQYRGAQATPIAPAEKEFLRTKLLDQNKPTIGDSINKCKFLLGDVSPSSPAKLRRWVNQFKKENYDIWVLEREGEKALNDKCVPYAEREWRDLAVGEAVVADGHKLNFQVINPFTGKPCRAMMVMFWDWKSSYPLGWEIMLTETIQCVVAAFRNAVITLGKFPKHALLDNGKAFRANIFRKKFRFQETEIPGIFDKLNIIPHYAIPYNAQSKPIERFFRTFNDWFERELPSYTGASISDKPARMNRNEKRAKDLHDEWVPTIPETMELIFRWREYYIDQELRARDGMRPRDIFEAEKGPGVDPFALHFLMMTCKARMVHRNGITFNGWHWYHENLYGLKDYVLMFYSYYDLSQVYIFTMKNGEPYEFLCVAKPKEKVKAFASDSEFPEDMAGVQRINALRRKTVNTTKKLADMLQSQKNLYIDWNQKFRDRPEVAEAIKQIEDAKKPKVVNLSPFANSPEPEMSVEEENKCPFDPPVAWARYEFHLKGGKYRGTEMDKQFMEDFRSGKIAPGLWESLYAEKERLESEEVNDERKVCHY